MQRCVCLSAHLSVTMLEKTVTLHILCRIYGSLVH